MKSKESVIAFESVWWHALFCAFIDELLENLRFRNKWKKGLISCACYDIL
nr:MAG TPA: hypothetical protein [Caudoviricetes sp.]